MTPPTVRADAVDVVIPAYNEEADLPGCLSSVLAQRHVRGINIVVIANGCSDRTTEIAAEFKSLAEAVGHRLSVLEMPLASKARALNAADPLLRGDVHVYLDADVVLSSCALRGLCEVLAHASGPRVACPLLIPLLPSGRVARSYAEAWMRLPSVADQVVGLGCYAVNKAGRRRWSAIPESIADDAFVRARFKPEERLVLGDEYFLYAFPSDRDLLCVLARWRCLNRALSRESPRDDPSSTAASAFLVLAAQPRVWKHLPAFALVSCAVRLQRTKSTSWYRARRRQSSHPPLAPRLSVGILPGGGDGELDRWIGSREAALVNVVQASGAALGDAFSRDGAEEIGDFVLLVGAGALADARIIDLLLLVARRFPWAGLYGARRAHDPSTAPRIRERSTLHGPLLLVKREVWAALGGFEGFAAYPARSAEICACARQRGFTPLEVLA